MISEITRIVTKKEFEQRQEDMYAIFQLNDSAEGQELLFMDTELMKRMGKKVEYDNYDMIYAAPWNPELSLNRIWEIFNVSHPEDFRGHSLSVSDIVVIRRNQITTAYFVDDIGFKDVTLEFWRPYQYAAAIADRFIMLQEECDYGYDYSIIDAKSYKVLDGGQYDDEDASIWDTWNAIYEDMLNDEYLCGAADKYSSIVQVDYDLLEEMVADAEKREREGSESPGVVEWFRKRTDLFFHPIQYRDQEFIEDSVRAYVLAEIDMHNIAYPDAELKLVDLVMCGSRCRGIEKKDSDIDFLLEYTGNISEDGLYNWLHKDGFEVRGIKVDINPVKAEKSGTAEEILLKYDRYLMNHMRTISYEEQFTLDMIVTELINRGHAARKQTVPKEQGDKEGIAIINPSGISPVIYLNDILESNIFRKWTLDEIVKEYISFNEKYAWKGMKARQMADPEWFLPRIYVGLRKATAQNIEKKKVSLSENIELEAYLYEDISESDELMQIAFRMPYHFETLGVSKEALWERAWKNTFEKSRIYADMHMFKGNPNGPIFTISSDWPLGAVSILNTDLMLELLGYSETGKERFYVAASNENEVVLVEYNEGAEQSEAFQRKLQDIRYNIEEDELLDMGYILELDRKKLVSLSKEAMKRELLKVMDDLLIKNSVCEHVIIQNGDETVLKDVSKIDAYMEAYEMSAEGNVECFMSVNGKMAKNPVFKVIAGVAVLNGYEVKSFACMCGVC